MVPAQAKHLEKIVKWSSSKYSGYLFLSPSSFSLNIYMIWHISCDFNVMRQSSSYFQGSIQERQQYSCEFHLCTKYYASYIYLFRHRFCIILVFLRWNWFFFLMLIDLGYVWCLHSCGRTNSNKQKTCSCQDFQPFWCCGWRTMVISAPYFYLCTCSVFFHRQYS